MKYLFPLVATSRWGDTELIYDVGEFHAFVETRRVDQNFTSWTHHYNRFTRRFEWLEVPNDWIIRDDKGRTIVQTTFGIDPSQDWSRIRRKRRGDFEHRSGPVPGLIGRRGRRASQACRKRHGGRGVAARIRAFNARRSPIEME